jgi:hypothetical protein
MICAGIAVLVYAVNNEDLLPAWVVGGVLMAGGLLTMFTGLLNQFWGG